MPPGTCEKRDLVRLPVLDCSLVRGHPGAATSCYDLLRAAPIPRHSWPSMVSSSSSRFRSDVHLRGKRGRQGGETSPLNPPMPCDPSLGLWGGGYIDWSCPARCALFLFCHYVVNISVSLPKESTLCELCPGAGKLKTTLPKTASRNNWMAATGSSHRSTDEQLRCGVHGFWCATGEKFGFVAL